MYRWVFFDDFPFNISLDDEMEQHFRNFIRNRPMAVARNGNRPVHHHENEHRSVNINSTNTTTTHDAPKRRSKSEKEPTCCICMTKKVEVVLIPCGHYKYCEKCSEQIKACAVCRTKIIGRQKVYP